MTHVREQLGAYVLGALEPGERAEVEAHLAECRACAAERDALAGLPALLDHAHGLEMVPPPAAMEERVLDAVARERGYFRQDYVRGLLDRHVAGREDNASQLWSLTMFELWHREFVDGGAPAAALAATPA